MPVRASEKARYPADWKVISLRIKQDRAGWRCECDGRCRTDHGGRCPNQHGTPSVLTGANVILTTAHLDHQPENCDDGNLMAMCQRCHLRYDRDHHAATRAANRS
jgi:hypothetical protein